MAQTQISLKSSQPFDFVSTIDSHGWVELFPNAYHSRDKSFSRIEELPSGKVIQIHVSSDKKGGDGAAVEIAHQGRLSKADLEIAENKIKHMLRMDEDFTEFYALCEQKGQPWAGMADGKGRLLRSPDLFEEIVKVICTTNIQWGGTKRMVKELVLAYGKPFPLDEKLKAFPRPEAIAAVPFEAFKDSVRLGYRAPFVYGLAVETAKDTSAIRSLLDESLETEEVKKRLLAIKGVGNYAAASILMLLGRYEDIPVDTVFRQMMRDKYFKQGEFELADALSIYEDWGKWRYLAYWFDLLDFYHSS